MKLDEHFINEITNGNVSNIDCDFFCHLSMIRKQRSKCTHECMFFAGDPKCEKLFCLTVSLCNFPHLL